MSDANKSCVLQHFEVLWNQGDIGRVGDYFSADFTNFGQRMPHIQGVLAYIIGTWRHRFSRSTLQRRLCNR